MTIQPGDAAAWAGVAVALGTGIVALVLSGLSRRDSKKAVREAGRAADAAERSAQADQEAQRIEQRRHHQERQPQFQASLGMTGTNADIPEVVLEYQEGPDLKLVEITLEPADGHRPAITTFGRLGTTWTLGNVRPGGRYRAPVSPPEPFGGRSWLVCRCVADNEEAWPVRTWVDAPRIGADVNWLIDSPAKDTYRLHNTGTEQATGVHVNFGPLDRNLVRNLPDPAQVESGGYVEFHAFLSLDQVPELAEVWVRWDGCERPEAVPMPLTAGQRLQIYRLQNY